MTAPAGFLPYSRPSRYLDLIGPVFEADGDPAAVGLRVDERHSNARGFTHAGVLVALADTLMGHTAQRAGPPGTRLVTVSLTTDFPGTAHVGDWVTGSAAVHRTGRTLAFAHCRFSVGDRPVLVASGVFAVAPQTDGSRGPTAHRPPPGT